MSQGIGAPPPREFEGYELVRLLGRGGMGEVYLARDKVLDRLVAIKLMSGATADAEARSRFQREARAIARLQHPNVVSIYAIGEVGGVPYLVSEFIAGQSLDRAALPLPWRSALEVGLGVARALAAAHRRGVVHRDVKPANVIVSEEGETKLLDFGIAKLVDHPEEAAAAPIESSGGGGDLESATQPVSLDAAAPADTGLDHLTRPGFALGTPAYMAPEIWCGQPATFRSDVYSLGCL